MQDLIKGIGKRLPFPVMLASFLGMTAMRDLRNQHTTRRDAGIPLFNGVDLAAYKKSDTLFILGSGPSINQIRRERWETIAQHDSVGMNFWLYHRFVPTFYFYEAFGADEWHDLYRRFRTLSDQRASDYLHVPKVMTRLEFKDPGLFAEASPEWRKNAYTVYTLPVVARTRKEFRGGIRTVGKFGLFKPATRISMLFKYTSSMTLLLSLAVRMRYRSIVLCGVDLSRNDYFFQDETLYPEAKGFLQGPKESKHHLVGDFIWLLKFPEVLREMQETVLANVGARVYLESSTSVLFPEVPLFEFPTDSVYKA
jgi:hypothetical protein